MSEDLNTIRHKLLDIVTLVKEVHEILIKLETQVDIKEINAEKTQSTQ